MAQNHNNDNYDENLMLSEAMDSVVQLASGASMASKNRRCYQNLQALMIRNEMPISAAYMRQNMSDTELLRIGLLAAIALISPWDQNPSSGLSLYVCLCLKRRKRLLRSRKYLAGHFLRSDHGVLLEAYHPSTSESDIMLCVVCSLLAIIIMFHVTTAQQRVAVGLHT